MGDPLAFAELSQTLSGTTTIDSADPSSFADFASSMAAESTSVASNPAMEFSDLSTEISSRQHSGFLWKAVDTINAFGYANANVVMDLADGGDFNLLKSYWDGLTLKDKVIAQDIFTQMGWKPTGTAEKILKGIVGFAADVAMDPLTYVGPGLVGKAGKLLKVGETAEIMAKASRAMGAADGTKVAMTFKVPFGKRHIIPGSDKIVDALFMKGSQAWKYVRDETALSKVIMALTDPVSGVSTKMRPSNISPVLWEVLKKGKEAAINMKREGMSDAIAGAREIFRLLRKELGADYASNPQIKDQLINLLYDVESTPKTSTIIDPIVKKVTELSKKFSAKRASISPEGKSWLVKEKGQYVPHVGVDLPEEKARLLGMNGSVHHNKTQSDLLQGWKKFVGNVFERDTKTGLLSVDKSEKTVANINKHIDETIKALTEYEVRSHDMLGEVLRAVDGLVGMKTAKARVKKLVASKKGGLRVIVDEVGALESKLSQVNKKIEILVEMGARPAEISGVIATKGKLISRIDKQSSKILKEIDAIEVALRGSRASFARSNKVDAVKKASESLAELRVKTRGLWEQKIKLKGDITDIKIKKKDYIVNLNTGKLYADGSPVAVGKMSNEMMTRMSDEMLTTGRITDGTIKEIHEGIGTQIFSTDLPEIMYVQGERTARTLEGDTFYQELKKIGRTMRDETGNLIKEDSDTARRIIDLNTGKPVRELAHLFFPEEVATHIEKYNKIWMADEATRGFFKHFDTAQNAWKTTATYWNLAFHSRNAVSNVFQNYLAGVNDGRAYAKAWNIFQKHKLHPGRMSPAETQIYKEYIDAGLQKIGYVSSSDIKKSLAYEMRTVREEAMLAWNNIVHGHVIEGTKGLGRTMNKMGGTLGESVEENAKLAHFIFKRGYQIKDGKIVGASGISVADAGMSVKKYLFDYEDLSQFERKYMKRLMPFYTFTRKNLPLQLEMLVTQPGRMNRVIKFKNNIEVMAGGDSSEEMLPEWMKGTSVYIGTYGDRKRYWSLDGYLPAADLNKLKKDNLVREMFVSLSPILKGFAEMSLNISFFNGWDNKQVAWKPISRQSGVKGFTGYGEEDYLGTRLPGRMAYLARLFRPLSELEKLMGRRYIDKNASEKILKFWLGLGDTELDVKYLQKNFKKLNLQEATAVAKEISELRAQIKRQPEARPMVIEDIKLLMEMKRKSRREGMERVRK